MRRLFKLKEWLTLEESAEYLAAELGEPVSVADLLRLSHSNHLRLSVNLINSCYARIGYEVGIREAKKRILPGSLEHFAAPLPEPLPDQEDPVEQLEWVRRNQQLFDDGVLMFHLPGLYLSPESVVQFGKDVVSIQGVWDLVGQGAERIETESRLLAEIGIIGEERIGLDGAFLSNEDATTYAQVMERMENHGKSLEELKKQRHDPNNYFPSQLPADAPLVIRTEEVSRLLASLKEAEEKLESVNLRADARQTYARVIGALWIKAHGDGRPGTISADPHTAAASLANLLATLELEKPSADKIGRILADEVPRAGIRVGTSDKKK